MLNFDSGILPMLISTLNLPFHTLLITSSTFKDHSGSLFTLVVCTPHPQVNNYMITY